MRYRVSLTNTPLLVARRIQRHDFFKVMDHYLALPEVLPMLSAADLRHYGWLERHENVVCAMNLLSIGQIDQADRLLDGFFSWDALYAALVTRRGLVTLITGTYLKIAMQFGVSTAMAKLVKKMKQILRR